MDYDQKTADNGMENEMLQLRSENSLLYYRPSQACLCSYRVTKIQSFANQSVTPGNIAQVLINCDDYVNGPGSYLKVSFDLVVPAAGLADVNAIWGVHGSILNLFQSIKFYHRSGQTLEEINNRLAQLMTIKRFYLYNTSERAQLDNLLGVGTNAPVPAVAGNYRFTAEIPLSLMLGSFNNHNQLLPPSFLAGSKIELGIYPLASILSEVLAGLSITNINMSLLLDTCMIYDSAKKQINEEVVDVKGSGLQYVYETNFFTTSAAFGPSGAVVGQSFNFDVQQSNTIVKNVFFVCVNETEIDTIAGATTSKHPFQNIVQTLQFRLGSQYYPNQAMNLVPRPASTGAAAAASLFIEDSSQAYQNVIMAFDAQNKQFGSYVNTNSITKPQYMSSLLATENAKMAVFGMLLDRGPQGVAYSGVPTNNSRLLNINGTIAKSIAVGAAFTEDTRDVNSIFVWTTSTRVANCIGDSLILDR